MVLKEFLKLFRVETLRLDTEATYDLSSYLLHFSSVFSIL